MTKKQKLSRKLPYVFIAAATCCFALILGVLISATPVYALSVNSSHNLNFAYNNNTSTLYSSPTGWSKGINESNATSGVVNLNYYNDSFNLTKDELPTKIQGADDHVLMINSKSSSDATPKVQYYTNTSSFDLDAYSNYQIKVYSQVTSGASASIYVTGLEDELAFEGIDYQQAREWTAYTFYITTGFEAQNIKLELWLGSKPNYVSNGAVFFDNIEITQISNKDINTTKSNTKYINLDKSTLISDINADFETTSLSDWTRINEMATDTYAEIINLSNSNESDSKEIDYVGTDYSANNTHALVLYTKNDVKSYIGYKSKNITLAMYDVIKVSVNVKLGNNIDGAAYIKVAENDIKNSKNEIISAITPANSTLTASANATNKYQNNYTTYTFYIKGRSLYNTSFNLELWLGSSSSPASGLVAFDNIKIENISYTDYNNATAGSYVAKLELDSDPATYTIANSAFNKVEKEEKELTYPLTPSDWKHNAEDENDIYFGVINTNDSVYNAHMSEFGSFANPGNPQGFGSTATDTNNILIMHNVNETYQSITSSDFDISSNSYYKLSFDYKLLETTSTSNILKVYIQDDDNNVLYADENISQTNGEWLNYVVYINTEAYSNTLKLIINLGTESSPACGVAYLDNVILVQDKNMTEENYEVLAENNKVLDFEQGNFNLVKYDKDGIYTPLRYTSNLENNEETGSALAAGFGGIIDASNTDDAYNIEKSPNSTSALDYIIMLQTMDKATYSLTAKDSLSLTADSYYKFTIDIKTQGLSANADDYDSTFGASFILSGIDKKLEGVVSADWTTYTIYVACTSSVTVNIKFALVSLDNSTSGIAYFDNYSYEVIDSDTYNLAELNSANDGTELFIGDTTASDDNDDSSSNINLDYIWYVIPTLILAVALILAIVAYFMKKLNIKKWEKRKINEYDRDKTVYRDVIRVEAEKRRDASIKEIKVQVEELEAEKVRIEEIHQQQLKASRTNRAKGVSKTTEREFKQYAKMHTAVENRIANLNKKIDNMNTAEYLLSLQHKIMLEKAKDERAAKEKAFKKETKKTTKKSK
ncbi:MAG: hypothetical protein E7376_02835 [Clostridiales bacterium]|nr:hypothetical protein [Clostridiales bacterium]